MTFEYLPVLIRTHPIGNAAKPERPVERIRIPVDIVGILVPDPPRMGLQIYFGNDDGTRFAHGTELLDGANHIIEMLERRLTEDDVSSLLAQHTGPISNSTSQTNEHPRRAGGYWRSWFGMHAKSRGMKPRFGLTRSSRITRHAER